jgi:hypothetical protein
MKCGPHTALVKLARQRQKGQDPPSTFVRSTFPGNTFVENPIRDFKSVPWLHAAATQPVAEATLDQSPDPQDQAYEAYAVRMYDEYEEELRQLQGLIST